MEIGVHRRGLASSSLPTSLQAEEAVPVMQFGQILAFRINCQNSKKKSCEKDP
jgi:hypothetical protein